MPFLYKVFDHRDVILLGTRHSEEAILDRLAEALPGLRAAGVTHIGLEIQQDQQPKLDRLARTGLGVDAVEIFHVIDCPSYRRLLRAVAESGMKPLALDLPRSMWHHSHTRDGWMARIIGETMTSTPGAKILVIVGNIHALKGVEWTDPTNRNRFIRDHLSADFSHLGVYSIVMECLDRRGESYRSCRLLSEHGLPAIVETVGLHFNLGVLNVLAAKPMLPSSAAEAVVLC